MIRTLYRVMIAALISLGLPALRVSAHPPAEDAAAGKDQALLPAYIERLEMRTIDSDALVAPVNRPLYSYADSARRIAEGAIWAWGPTGRPLAMAKCWKNANETRTCAFTLTSDARVVALGPQSKLWKPAQTQVEPAQLKDAPAPARQDTARLRQLKEQARRFSAHEFWEPDNSRFELRLLVQPIYRYQDEQRQIQDAAVFIMAFDNNPQILMSLEILGSAAGEARWQYLLARVSSAELHVSIDDKEVWKQQRTPAIVGRPNDYYWHMVTAPDPPNGP